jgi:hypothetical protein
MRAARDAPGGWPALVPGGPGHPAGEDLGELIAPVHPRFLLDLHGSHPFRPYEVDLGSLNGYRWATKNSSSAWWRPCATKAW